MQCPNFLKSLVILGGWIKNFGAHILPYTCMFFSWTCFLFDYFCLCCYERAIWKWFYFKNVTWATSGGDMTVPSSEFIFFQRLFQLLHRWPSEVGHWGSPNSTWHSGPLCSSLVHQYNVNVFIVCTLVSLLIFFLYFLVISNIPRVFYRWFGQKMSFRDDGVLIILF